LLLPLMFTVEKTFERRINDEEVFSLPNYGLTGLHDK
jgi:hypothetical protein